MLCCGVMLAQCPWRWEDSQSVSWGPWSELNHCVSSYGATHQLVSFSFSHPLFLFLPFFSTDPAAVDLDQYELPALAECLRGYLQDLVCPIIPAVVASELMYTAQGRNCVQAKSQPFLFELNSVESRKGSWNTVSHLHESFQSELHPHRTQQCSIGHCEG